MNHFRQAPVAARTFSRKCELPGALLLAALIAAAAALQSGFAVKPAVADEPAAKAQMLDHTVFFTLADSSPANVQKVIDGCKKYLTGHPGEVSFAVGRRSDLAEQFNDRDFDLVLHMVFKSRAAFDAYIPSEHHQEFIKQFKSGFKKIRVFDSYLDAE